MKTYKLEQTEGTAEYKARQKELEVEEIKKEEQEV